MKKTYKLLAIFVLLQLLLSSCATNDFFSNSNRIEKRKYSKGWHMNKTDKICDNIIQENTREIDKNENTIKHESETPLLTSNKTNILDLLNPESAEEIIEKPINYSSSEASNNDCDQIILKNGDIIDAIVLEIGIKEVKYKKCANQEGPTYSILKTDIFMIKYKNGDKDMFKDEEQIQDKPQEESSIYDDYSRNNNYGGSVDGLAIASLVTGLVGLITGWAISGIIGFALGLLGIIFGGIALSNIKNIKNRRGKGLAITGLVAGLIISALFLVMVLMW